LPELTTTRTQLKNRERYTMQDVPKRPPLSSVFHESNAFSTTGSRCHRRRRLARINSRLPINQLLERLASTDPDEQRRSRRSAKDLAIVPRPLLHIGDGIVLRLQQSLVDQRPAGNMWRQVRASWVSRPVLPDAKAQQQQSYDFCVSNCRGHCWLSSVGLRQQC